MEIDKMNFKRVRNYLGYFKRNIKYNVSVNKRVIDIGSGHVPLVRADVLFDLPPATTMQRPVAGIYTPPNRFVVGDIHELPFQDNSFDYVINRAVLEHVSDPIKVCTEFSRIGKAGLIIVPSYLWEIMGGAAPHLWLIKNEEGTLTFYRKTAQHRELNVQIPTRIKNSQQYENLFNHFYHDFYIDYYWEGNIKVKVVDEEGDINVCDENFEGIVPEEFSNQFKSPKGISRKLKVLLYETFRKYLGGRNFDLYSITACPVCKKSIIKNEDHKLICNTCRLSFPIVDDVPFLDKRFSQKVK